jgi:hypothetical protein
MKMTLSIIEKNNQRVLTTSQLAESYGTDSERINKNFNRNKERYNPGKHFFLIEGDSLKEFRAKGQIDLSSNINRLYLWTEKGAWLHAKSLNTDEAWDAYETLVDEYYRLIEKPRVLTEKEQLRASMKLSLDTSEEVEVLKIEVNDLKEKVENQITIDHGEQRRLQKAIGSKVYELESIAEFRPKLFKELYREIKDRFGVASYKDVKRKDLQMAIRYVDAWIPRKVA